MRISKQARREAKELFLCCTVDGRLDNNRVRNAVRLVIEAKPRGYLAVLSHFERLVKLAVEKRTARIESAAGLAEDLQSRIQSDLTRVYGPGLSFAFGQDPGLIGGLRIKVGSDVYDGSIKAKLAALEESF